MKIGDSIEVSIDGLETFRSKVIDVKDSDIYISCPKELQFSSLRPQHVCSVNYIKNEMPHRFESAIEQYSEEDIPYIVLSLPEKSNIKRIQRREYVRIKSNVDIAIYFENKNIDPIVTVTQDISGGGLRAVLKEELPLEVNDFVNIYMVLRNEQGNYEYIQTKAEVLRHHLEKGVHSVSMLFLLDEKIRQKIISYCFQVQREYRKQGLH